MTTDVAENLLRLRSDRGLSQAQLARVAAISRVTLARIERREVEPRAETVARLASALGVPLGDLYSPAVPLEDVRFRSRGRINGRDQILAELGSRLTGYEWLESELGVETPSPFGEIVARGGPPKRAAEHARRVLNLGAVEAVRDGPGLLERNGIKILLLRRRTPSFFGFSVARPRRNPAIVVNAWDRLSVERWLFTAFHELGHVILHAKAFDTSLRAENESEEREADRFASRFLLPEDALQAEWRRMRGLSLVARVLKIKRMFQISYKTVLRRIVESGLSTEDVFHSFCEQYSESVGGRLLKMDDAVALREGESWLDWRRSGEPDGLSPNDFLPARLAGLVRLALEKEAISLGRAGELLELSREEMRRYVQSWGS